MAAHVRRILLGTLVCALALAAAPAVGAAPPRFDRLYLMGSPTDHLNWSVDPADPELSLTTVRRHCGTAAPSTSGSKPCLTGSSGTARTYNITFFAASVLDESVTFSSAQPGTFRLALEVNSPVPYTVHFVNQQNLQQTESPAATQVSPGVWEGKLTAGTVADKDTGTMAFQVRVRTDVQAPVELLLRTSGASYLQLPEAVAARSVPMMAAQDTYAPAPSTLTRGTRSFRFNDDQWEVASFTGDLGATKKFTTQVAREAALAIAWVDVFETPHAYDVLRRQPGDPLKLTDMPILSLDADGAHLANGGNLTHERGRGMDAAAAVGIPPGPLNLTVSRNRDGQGAQTYTAHILVVYGQRTLAGMRWRWHPVENEPFTPFRLVGVGGCTQRREPVPLLPTVVSYRYTVGWDSANPQLQKWTPSYDQPGSGSMHCGEAGTGNSVRITKPEQSVRMFSATPPQDAQFLSTGRDTVFDSEVDFIHAP